MRWGKMVPLYPHPILAHLPALSLPHTLPQTHLMPCPIPRHTPVQLKKQYDAAVGMHLVCRCCRPTQNILIINMYKTLGA